MLKVILFDIDNTLLSFDEYVKEAMKSGFKKFEICEYSDGMFDIFNQINTGLWQQIEKGKITLNELEEIRWNMIFEHLGVSGDGAAFEKFFRDCLFESAIPENGAVELLGYLHGGYVLCAASNGPYHQQVNRLKISGMLPFFSDLFISEEIGCSKPSEEFFDACLKRLNSRMKQNILPEEIMIIGDSLSSDIAGGINYGLKTCYYNPHMKAIPCELKPDYVVTTLKEIKNIL